MNDVCVDRQDRSAPALRSAVHVTMRNSSDLGIVIRPAPVAPLRELLVALLAGAVALRQLDWWKLLARAGHLPTRRRQILVHVAAIGLTFTGSDASEEVAEDEESPLRSAMGHALLRVALEAVLFYTLLTLAIACGLSDGENGNHENDALAYLADTFVGGWGEPLLHALGCVMFVAACEITRGGIVVWMGMTSAGSKLAFVLRHLRIGRTEGSPIQIERASPAIT